MITKQIAPLVLTGLVTVSSVRAASIVYAFTGQSASVTSNGLAGDGVTAQDVNIITTGSNGWQIGSTQIDELDVISMKLGGTANASFSFTIDIPSSVTIDITTIDFAFDYESNNGSGLEYYAGWDLSLSQGTPLDSSGSVGPYFPGNTEIQRPYTVPISGLASLSDTSVTFTFSADNGVNPDFSSGNANDRRTIFDDITLTASVVPEPSTAGLFGLAGLGLCLRRRR